MSTKASKTQGISAVVDMFWAVPGVMKGPKDGPIIAGLCGRYGSATVLKRIEEMSLELGASDNPLLYLVHLMKKVPKTPEPIRPAVLKEEMDEGQRRANLMKVGEMMAKTMEGMERRKRSVKRGVSFGR